MCLPGNLRGKCSLTLKIPLPQFTMNVSCKRGGQRQIFKFHPEKMAVFVFLLTKSGQDFPTVLFLQNFKSFIAGSDLGPVWETAISARGAAPFLLGCGFRVFLHSTHC